MMAALLAGQAAPAAQLAQLVRMLLAVVMALNAELARLLHLTTAGATVTRLRVPHPAPALGGMAMCWTALRLDDVRTEVLRDLDQRHGPWWAVRQVRQALAERRDEHEALPSGAVRVRDGQPANLTEPDDYPVVADCTVCGRPVRCEHWFREPWVHLT